MIDIISTSISVIAVGFAVLMWLETMKQTRLLRKIMKSLPYTSRARKRNVSPQKLQGTVIQPSPSSQTEERRRLKLELEKEKLQWQKNKDIAKGIAWIVDRLSEPDDYNYE